MKKKIAYIGTALAFPFLAFAQNITSVQSLAQFAINFINNVLTPLVFAAAFIVFIIGVFQTFIMGGHDAEKQTEGRAKILWGLVGFFVMLSVWGLVNILVGSVNLNSNVPTYPTAPSRN